MTQNFEYHTHPKYLVNNICSVCSRVTETPINQNHIYWFPITYLERYKTLLHYSNLSYYNIFDCQKIFKYKTSHSILDNLVLNDKDFDYDTNKVISIIHNFIN